MIKKKQFKTYYEVFKILDQKHKFQIVSVFFFLIFLSFVELISIDSIIPFVIAIQDPNLVLNSIYYKEYILVYNLNEENLETYLFALFICLVFFSLLLKIIFLRINCNLSYDIIRLTSELILDEVLSKNFIEFNNFNSKDIITSVVLRAQSVGETFFHLISSAGSLVIIIFLIISCFFFIGNEIIFLFISLFLIYLFWWKIIKSKIQKYGLMFSKNYEKMIKNTSEIMNMFPEIKLYNIKNFFLNDFKKNNYDLRKSQGMNTFVSGYPAVVIQSLIITGLIIMIFLWNKYGSLNSQIPILTFLILNLQRIIPNFQNIFKNHSAITYMSENFNKTISLILKKDKKKIIHQESNEFKKFNEITLNNVSYKNLKNTNNFLLEGVNLKIKRGDKIAIMGPSGSGKTTLINLIMGFISDYSGEILINKRNLRSNLTPWHNAIAYVPQKIFMLQKDIYTNISLQNKISEKNKKNIDKMLDEINLKSELMTKTGLRNPGEEGKSFSGGQLQRLAIGRSLYQKREFLILDETLNALDRVNSLKIIEDLKKNKDLTIILISHNEEIALKMDRIIKIKNKNIDES